MISAPRACIVLVAVSSAPVARLPVCGDADWEAMGRAMRTACASAGRSEHDATACRVVGSSWRCPADIRRADSLDALASPASVVVLRPKEGEFYGIVFERRDGTWRVVDFTSGDTPRAPRRALPSSKVRRAAARS